MNDSLSLLQTWFRNYVRPFHETDDELIRQAIQMKEMHTGYVLKYCRELAQWLSLEKKDVALCEVMGLLHDVGRFFQFQKYKTFNDADSEDHAQLGLSVIEKNNLLKNFSQKERDEIIFAIGQHNKKIIAPTNDPRKKLFAQILRDADKLDIYRVLEPYLTKSNGDGVNDDFVEKFARGEQCDYTKIQTQDDRKLVRLMWFYDINFSWTMKRLCEKKYFEKIVECLPHDEKIFLGVERLKEHISKKVREENVHENFGGTILKKLVIAIDGPAGAGKSTIAKLVAAKLNYVYIDTGAMYRAVAWLTLQNTANKSEISDEDILQATEQIQIELKYYSDELHVLANGQDVSQEIRTPEVTHLVSRVAQLGFVREKMLHLQRSMAKEGGVVMDGRDIASKVLPNADVKIFLTASIEERARRRYQEMIAKNFKVDLEELKKEIAARDKADTERKISPLVRVKEAVLIDSTSMTIDEVTEKILELTKK